jgi:hypothetical protein
VEIYHKWLSKSLNPTVRDVIKPYLG